MKRLMMVLLLASVLMTGCGPGADAIPVTQRVHGHACSDNPRVSLGADCSQWRRLDTKEVKG